MQTRTMCEGLNTLLAVLLLSGWASEFKTKMCDHEKNVEAIKNTYDCALQFGKETLQKDIDLANGGKGRAVPS